MREETITLYRFDELSRKAKEHAIEMARIDGMSVDDGWYFGTIEDFCDTIKYKYGLEINPQDVRFSGFWSQGDGASFTLDELSGDNFIRMCREFGVRIPMVKLVAPLISFSITRNSYRYYHSGTLSIHIFVDGSVGRRLAKRLDEFEEELKDWLDSSCTKLYKSLEEEFFYLTGDEYISEMLQESFYEFDINGDMWRA